MAIAFPRLTLANINLEHPNGESPIPANAPPPVTRVTVPNLDRRIHVFRCGRIVDSFAVVTERFVVVVDTMISPEAAVWIMRHLRGELRSRPRRRLMVVNTHGDWDHCWGNALFDGPAARYPAPIIGLTATRRRFNMAGATARLRKSQEANPGWFENVEFRLPSLEFVDGLAVQGGDLTLELIPTPGHTPDHISVWIPELRTLLAGDAAELPMPYAGDDSSLPQLRQSLRTMLDLDPAVVLYCHGGDIHSPDLIRHNIWYFDEAERRCRYFLAENLAAADVSGDTLSWPLEAVLPARVTTEDIDVDFYRRSHDRAIAAMGRWIADSNTAEASLQIESRSVVIAEVQRGAE